MEKKPDIYFEEDYGRLYEEVEDGVLEVFNFKCEYGEVNHQFIKKRIPQIINGEQYFDIVTPYGYGGPLVKLYYNDQKNKLLELFERKFGDYCLKSNIVSEFIRFHPVFNNSEDFKSIYKVQYLKNTLGTDLTKEDPFQEEFTKKCRQNIRKSLKKGVTYEVIDTPDNYAEFITLYYSTMDRNSASSYYYFKESYFNHLLKFLKKHIIIVKAIYDGKVIAAGLYFKYKDMLHVHLSGTLTSYLNLSPAYILRYAITLWGKENGYKLIHHGGGRSNSEDDSLYKFKRGFSKNISYNFSVGKKIWNEKIYRELCGIYGVHTNNDFFPAYRVEKDRE